MARTQKNKATAHHLGLLKVISYCHLSSISLIDCVFRSNSQWHYSHRNLRLGDRYGVMTLLSCYRQKDQINYTKKNVEKL